MRIGELAKKADCDVETVRYYEKMGLLDEPTRNGSGYREYRDAHLERLLFIRHCRSLRMGLHDIRALLDLQTKPATGCERVNTLLDRHIEAIQLQMAALRSLESQLISLRRQCNVPHSVQECGILQNLSGTAVALDG